MLSPPTIKIKGLSHNSIKSEEIIYGFKKIIKEIFDDTDLTIIIDKQ